MSKYTEEFKKIISLVNENKFVEAENLFEEILLEEVSERLLEKKEGIIEKLKMGELNERAAIKWPERGTASVDQMVLLVKDEIIKNKTIFDDSDNVENIEYFLKDSTQAKKVRDILENKFNIVTVYKGTNKGVDVFWLGLKDKKYDKDGDEI